MSHHAPQRLYLMQVGDMPQYEIPIVCYLVQTGDGKHSHLALGGHNHPRDFHYSSTV